MTEEAKATVILNGQQANATLKEIEKIGAKQSFPRVGEGKACRKAGRVGGCRRLKDVKSSAFRRTHFRQA